MLISFPPINIYRLFFLCFVILFLSCSITGQGIKKGCSDRIKTLVKDYGWKYNDTLKYYVSDKDLLVFKSNENIECFKNLNKSQIVELFGKPSIVNDEYKRIEYYLSPPCGTYCEFLSFVFDENNKVEIVRLGTGSTSY